MVRGKVRGRHLDPVGAGDGLLDVVVDREAPQRARHLRLDVRVARVFRRGKNERVDAARLLRVRVRVRVRARVRVRVKVDAARRRNLLGDLIVDREVAQRARHARLHLRVAAVLRRGVDERLDAARDSDLLGHLVTEGEVAQRASHLRLHEARVHSK